MSATGSVRGFTEFDDLCRGHQGYSYNLAALFELCDHDELNRHRHAVSFLEALKRLKLKIVDSFSDLHIQTKRKVTDYTIGKTFVKQKIGASFNPMKPNTWSLGGGINGRWHDYKKDDYDGLIVLACIERDLIPQNIKECYKRAIQKTIAMNQQNYALALEQALIQYYALIKPDERMRNQSFDIGNLSKEIYKGGIVYVAYKLEPEPSYSDDELEAPANSVPATNVKQAAIDHLNLLLKENGLYFCCDISNDGNSFFQACSDQLSRLELAKMDHLQLRQLIIPQLKDVSDEKKESINLANESWETYLTTIEKEGTVVGDIVVERMAKFWRRKIVIYSRSDPDEITEEFVNEEDGVNGPPLLLAKEKLYYQSLKRGDGNVEVKGESTILKRPAPTEAAVANPSSPLKKQKKKTLVDEHKISTSTPSGDNETKTEPKVQFIPRQKIDDGAQITGGRNPSNTSSSKSLSKPKINMSADENTSSSQSPSKPKIQMSANENTATSKAPSKPKLNMSTDEKKLILKTYIKQEVKTDWDKLRETVYLHRHECLPRTTFEHYEKTLTPASLKQRIKSFIQSVMRGKKENEKDLEVIYLISKMNEQTLNKLS
ncbi:uncharacterized protein LOC134691284 [Mytilus trossulus]|uniref:uncharacterized protein LOC134691284 n=1 Tax=Mytilus trossulus TaxID=6551 RepID=UPI0030048E71